jgi:hypothetical protein
MSSPTWAAVRIWVAADVRRRWRSWAVLGLLAGVTIGLAAAGVAGARRTASAVPRFERASQVPDAAVLANSPEFDVHERTEMDALPEVQESFPFEVAFVLNPVKPSNFASTTLLPTTPGSVKAFSGVLVAGRVPNPDRADEVVVDENARRLYGLGLGSTMVVAQSVSPEEAKQLPPGLVPPHVDLNYTQSLTVVGISKSVSSDPGWAASSGFYAKYGPRTPGFVNAFVALRGGQNAIPRFAADMTKIVGHPVNVESTQDLDGLRKAKDVTGVEREGLLLFALAVVLGGGVLVGQALVRAVTAGAADLPTWRAMGTDNATIVPTLALPTLVTVGGAVLTTVVTAIALSSRFPLGLGRTYDLDVGFHADWLVLGLAALAVALGILVTAVLAAIWSTRERAPRHHVSSTGTLLARASFPPALDVGFRLAVEPGRGRSAVPVRSALIGAVVGVLGVVGCLTFRAGLDNAVKSPQRSGVVWNFTLAAEEGRVARPDVATIARDPDTKAVLETRWARALTINGVATPTFGTQPVKASLPFVLLSGRAPGTNNEIAFAPTTMRALHLHVGDEITAGRTAHVRVVGEVLLPATSHTDYDQSGWMTSKALDAALPPPSQQGADDVEDYMLIRIRPGADVAAAEARLSHVGGDGTYDTAVALRPVSVIDLGRLKSLPLALAIFFGLLAVATVAHALVTTVRRRRHDLAILRSLGFTRGESRVAIAWQATLLGFAGALVGAPLGVLAGQRFWRALANAFPLVYATPLALIALILVIPLALVVANLLAVGPAHAATRISPAAALRVE